MKALLTILRKSLKNLDVIFAGFYSCIPLLYLIFIISRRLNIRSPRDLLVPFTDIQLVITLCIILGMALQLVIILCIIFGMALRVYFSLKKAGIIPEKEVKNRLLLWIKDQSNKVTLEWITMWVYFYFVIVYLFPQINFLLLGIARKIRFLPKKYFLYLYLGFNILPRFIVVTIFGIEVFFTHELHYFYYSLILLLIYMLSTVFEPLMTHFGRVNFLTVKNYLVWGIPKYPKSTFVGSFIKPEYFIDEESFFKTFYEPLYTLPRLPFILEQYKFKLREPLIAAFIAIIYLIGWITVFSMGYSLRNF